MRLSEKLSYKEQKILYTLCHDLFWYKEGKLIRKKGWYNKKRVVEGEDKIMVGGIPLSVTQIIFLMHNKELPWSNIKYKDGNSLNKKIENFKYPPKLPKEQIYIKKEKINKNNTWFRKEEK